MQDDQSTVGEPLAAFNLCFGWLVERERSVVHIARALIRRDGDSGPPGACMTPSRDMNVDTINRLMVFSFVTAGCAAERLACAAQWLDGLAVPDSPVAHVRDAFMAAASLNSAMMLVSGDAMKRYWRPCGRPRRGVHNHA